MSNSFARQALSTVAACVCAVLSSVSVAQVNLSGLVSQLQSIPDGGWVKVNLNRFQDAWVADDLRPLYGLTNPSPADIIKAWSSFAWDSKRGDLILFGGGHANYTGNEVYRWRGTTRRWEAASLPSEIASTSQFAVYLAVDGALSAPASAHTYDNNLYLPVSDRFITFGGAAFNSGAGYVRPLTDGTWRSTGPYTFDLDRANPDLVGGTTGSHVKRVDDFPTLLGGYMWENRDAYGPDISGGDIAPPNFVSGYSAYAQENGKDVVYMGGKGIWATDNQLFRYTIHDPSNPALDQWEKVGRFWGGNTGAGSAAYDSTRKLFVFTGASSQANAFGYWDVNYESPTNNNVNFTPTDLSGEFDFSLMYGTGLDFHPQSGTYKVWYGGGNVFSLNPPPTNVPTGWTLTKEIASSAAAAPPMEVFNGVWGKFKYIPNLNAFMALEGEFDGNVWLYRPYGWQPPAAVATNLEPSISITSPTNFSSIAHDASLTLSVIASDPDGSIASVEFVVDGQVVGTRTQSPYAITLSNLPIGLRTLSAKATDNLGVAKVATPIGLWVLTQANTPPTVAISSPDNGSAVVQGTSVVFSANASDSDGTVDRVEFYVDGAIVATDTAAPYFVTLNNLAVGTHVLTARAIDNLGAISTVDTANLTINPVANTSPLVNITAPTSGSSAAANVPVTMTVQASDSDGTIAQVQFLVDGIVVNTVTSGTSPYSYVINGLTEGTHTLTARATDNLGAITTSAPITITITPVVTGGTTVVLQDGLNGYAGTRDTYLSSYNKATNYAAATSIYSELTFYTNLYKFAIFAAEGGPVPNGATIISAKLSVYKTTPYYDTVATARRMLVDWVETEASWNRPRIASTWGSRGASASGSDYLSTADGTGSLGWTAGWIDIDVSAGVQAFSAGSANNGWRLDFTGYNLKAFASRENSASTLRPKLEVVYSVGG